MKKFLSILALLIISLPLFATKPVILDIQARASKGTKINLFWVLPENPDQEITKLLIYRSTTPITRYSQIKNLTPIAELPGTETGYTDSVKDYKDYFYAVITVTDKPYEIILASMNSTVNGVHLKLQTKQPQAPKKQEEEKLYTNGTKRETPLPYLDMIEGMNEDSSISEATVQSTTEFSTSKKSESEILTPYFFEEDLVSPDGGDDYILFDILKNTFVQRKYSEADAQLKKLVKRNISESVQNRAYFYIGESEYFLGNYEEAVKAFIQVSHVYPLQTYRWINACMDKIEITE